MDYRKTKLAIVALMGLVSVVSSDAKDEISDDGLTVSHENSNEPPFEWTLERMMLAEPMPMTGEGRDFASMHPALESIRSWTDAQFNKYLDCDYAKQYVVEVVWRWQDIVRMLETQVARGYRFLGKSMPDLSQYRTRAKASAPTDWRKLPADDVRKMLEGKERKVVFEQLKDWRQEIAYLAPKVEAMRKEAKAKGVSDRLEQVMTPDQ